MDMPSYDTLPPVRGDVLAGPTIVYRVLDSRAVESRVWCNRWRVSCERIGARKTVEASLRAGLGQHKRWLEFVPYRKGEKPGEVLR